ncbi:BEL1-like homeodomain protein 4 [Impatiens glandulifera]|uniref:BEL1-like homeodomain protein 4 n=1 Tax=Impatiens glandulifera TaxID=253017 RepID=UPI001FB0F2EC|nr:BEL1-like homeodomain protein 4 [Impatiens glandulifera]
MSQDFHNHQSIYNNFSNNDFERSQVQDHHQIRRDKHIRSLQGFDSSPSTIVGIDEDVVHSYESAGMLSEMFNFQQSANSGPTAMELLESQISQNYGRQPVRPTPSAGDWYNTNTRQDSSAAMQLFLMNPNPNNPNPNLRSQLSWLPDPTTAATSGENRGNTIVEGQGLSLSLSSSLAAAEELRMREGNLVFYNQGVGSSHPMRLGFSGSTTGAGGGSMGMVNMLRNSKYSKPAQELLEEFCCVGRGQFKKNQFGKIVNNSNPNQESVGVVGSGSTSKDLAPLSAADRIEHQRRKVKLLSMLDEVDRRYNHYCEQMQMVVNTFDMAMGFGAAVPYTALAQKAMSRHFRCLKDAITVQLKHSYEILGEKDAGTSGITKGETPRLKLLEQSLRQQRAFHQMGMMEQEAWRPQRGLPERSVNILRAWLFEHFLHPYPSDADKHLLARQTGLSRNQVSNWFINARVRLWKPMVEDMYQQEAKEEDYGDERETNPSPSSSSAPPPPLTNSVTPANIINRRFEINALENDPSLIAINRQFVSENQANHPSISASSVSIDYSATAPIGSNDHHMGSTLIRFGTGDVSLTLGLRHAGNVPDKNPFSVRDFGAC